MVVRCSFGNLPVLCNSFRTTIEQTTNQGRSQPGASVGTGRRQVWKRTNLRNGLNLLGVSSFVQQVVIGAVIILAVLMDMAFKQRKK